MSPSDSVKAKHLRHLVVKIVLTVTLSGIIELYDSKTVLFQDDHMFLAYFVCVCAEVSVSVVEHWNIIRDIDFCYFSILATECQKVGKLFQSLDMNLVLHIWFCETEQ